MSFDLNGDRSRKALADLSNEISQDAVGLRPEFGAIEGEEHIGGQSESKVLGVGYRCGKALDRKAQGLVGEPQ